MRKFGSVLWLAFGCLLLSSHSWAENGGPVCVKGRYLFPVSDVSAKRAEAVQLLARASGRQMKLQESAPQTIVVTDRDYLPVPPDHAISEAFTSHHPCFKLRRLNRQRLRAARLEDRHAPVRTYACECDTVVYSGVLPNDPSFGSLWGLNDANGIRAPEAWETTRGSNEVVVGIVDTGIDYTHPDLSANIWQNDREIPGNGIDDDTNGYADDVYGYNFYGDTSDPLDDNDHGTHVAGTIGAVGDNNAGIAGVNWNVRMIALKFLGASGSGYTSGAVAAVNYAVGLKARGVNLVALNNSWGGGGYSAALRNAIALANYVGILFVAAAGNDSSDNDLWPTYPAAYDLDNVLAVASLNSAGTLSWFSNFGAAGVDIAAPGSGILSTIPGGAYASFSGTSMATPHVAGAAALLRARFPSLSVAEIKNALLNSARPLEALSGKVATGGTLDLQAALAAAAAPSEPSPAPTATPEPTFTPIPTAPPTPGTGVPGTPEATPTGTPTATPTEEPPAPTATPTPSPTPAPLLYDVSGRLRIWTASGRLLRKREQLRSGTFQVVAVNGSGERVVTGLNESNGYSLRLPAGRYSISVAGTYRNFYVYPRRRSITVRGRRPTLRVSDFLVRLAAGADLKRKMRL